MLGDSYTMPTIEQFQELFNNEYTSNKWEQVNGIYGCTITSLINNNSIFMPAAGYAKNNVVVNSDTHGFYWQSSLLNTASAHRCKFNSDEVNYDGNGSRYYGFLIRPVQNTTLK